MNTAGRLAAGELQALMRQLKRREPATVTGSPEQDDELREATLRVSGQVCEECGMPTHIAVLELFAGRCPWCADEC